MKKRIIAILLVLILSLSALAGCGTKQEETKQPEETTGEQTQNGEQEKENEKEPEPEGPVRKPSSSFEENALRVSYGSELTTIDPNHVLVGAEMDVASLIYDTLMVVGEDGEYEPWICTKMEPNEDQTAVYCEIRDDVYFASGDKLVMEDILYSFEKLNLSTQNPYVYDNSSIEPVDDTHFIWHFDVPGMSYAELGDIANGMYVYNKSFCEQFCDDPTDDLQFHADGTGAYRLESPITAGTHDTVLVKNEHYWNSVSIDKIIFKYVSGDTEMAFEAGDIDYCKYSPDTFQLIKDYANVGTSVEVSPSTVFLITNCYGTSPFSDIRVREAFQYSFDRETVGLLACNNGGEVAWQMFTPGCENYADVVPHRTLDADKARALMSEAGYSAENPCRIVMITKERTDRVSAYEALKEDADKCYFDCVIELVPDLSRYFSGDFDIAVIDVDLGNDFNSYAALLDPETGFDLAGYVDLELSSRIFMAKDPDAAKQAMIDFDATMAYVPIAYLVSFYAYDDRLDLGPYITDYDRRKMRWNR